LRLLPVLDRSTRGSSAITVPHRDSGSAQLTQ